MDRRQDAADVAKLADMLAAMGTEPRLRIMRLLLSAHPDGLVVSDIQENLGINGSTLSHHLERLKHEDLIVSRREGTYLRYSVNADSLRTLLFFLYAECCGRNKAITPDELFQRCNC
jgi:DNA-binding transcriptional ArsR family regulator